FDYGPSYNQIHMINGDHLHDVGYRGQGMLIGVLDAGFANADNLAVFDSLWDHNQIIATHDFVSGGPVTFDQHSHGTAVLSIMGGNYAGEIIGTAPKASYILMRTEDGPSEYIIEEYNWVSGAEFADSLGADILNTSLGYNEFYDTLQNHTYENMDGNTAPITIGADIAASRGIVVVNSAGNAGTWAWYYITAPADGDSVFSIGSVNAQGNPSGFSSHGPTYDGRIKPNVAAQGEGAYYALTGGGFQYGNGTSFSSPVMAGMMACLRQAHPEMNNMELINAVQESASIATAPDNKIGYGIPDFMAALTVVEVNADAISDIKLYPNPFSSSIEIAFYAENRTNSVISILDMTGRLVFEHQFMLNKGKNRLKLSSLDNIPAGIYFMRMEVDGTAVAMKIVKQ
ncbi:MAG: S8 family serine peptidase, partial [Bacteroidota bacterium]